MTKPPWWKPDPPGNRTILFFDELPRADAQHIADETASVHARAAMLARLKTPKGTKLVTKPKAIEYAENREHCCWTIGYNACKARVLRRLNQFKRGTEGYAQWSYGWDAAFRERGHDDNRVAPLPRNYANEKLMAAMRKAGIVK